jgi:hypothetical protein
MRFTVGSAIMNGIGSGAAKSLLGAVASRAVLFAKCRMRLVDDAQLARRSHGRGGRRGTSHETP